MTRSADANVDFIYESTAMAEVVDICRRVAAHDIPALIVGETGSGKEHLARQIHTQSPRSDGPFVPLNCAALPESIFESELFGHEKGAFTGAEETRQGMFRAAEGGTIFLDEVGEIPLHIQPRLLRALEARRVRPVGATGEVPIDVRIIAATNREIDQMVDDGRFRRDLYHRLKAVGLRVPSLRERPEDTVPLAMHFMERACAEFCCAGSCNPCELTDEAVDALKTYSWPGNVRELENAIQRGVVLAEGKPAIELGDLPPEVRDPRPASTRSDDQASVAQTLAEVEKEHILRTLDRFDGNRRQTARALEIGETTLWRRLKTYGVAGVTGDVAS